MLPSTPPRPMENPSDNSKAFLDAWNAACEFNGNATFLVPQGNFQLGPVKFGGPCSVSTPRVEIGGTLQAPPSLDSFNGDCSAWIDFEGMHDIFIGGVGGIDGRGSQAWSSSSGEKPVSLRFANIINGGITNLTLKDSKFFHVGIHSSQSITVDHLNISAPHDSKNTDGVHVSNSTNVYLSSLTIGTGDDCVSIGPGSVNVTVTNIQCGPGHGLSIGSLGKYKDEQNVAHVRNQRIFNNNRRPPLAIARQAADEAKQNVAHVTVKNCSVTGTTNGLRIKKWPGSSPSEAFNITFEDVVLNNVSNPIIIDQDYCPGKDCNNEPSKVKIHDVSFTRITGTSNTPVAVQLNCSELVPCQNVKLEEINLEPLASFLPNISSICSHVLGMAFGTQNPDPCLSLN
ncbi:hypothetical protein LUZ60_013909 [Juncus effusus]|nr:hypothetical protein LUZ60_013909 [Juncus effusus]